MVTIILPDMHPEMWRIMCFGLPARPLLGSVFLAAAFGAGLDAPIMNPGSKRFMDTVYSYRVLSVEDEAVMTRQSMRMRSGPMP